MWKSIEIKPNDSSLVGRKIKLSRWFGDYFEGVTILFVGRSNLFAVNAIGEESRFEIKSDCGWQIWEEPTRWKPELHEVCFHVYGNGEINQFVWENDDLDDLYFKIGNVFRTREQAQTYAEECKKLAMKLHEEWGE